MRYHEAPPAVIALKPGETLDRVHPEELARQITLITQRLLGRVRHYELLMLRWTRPGWVLVSC